MLRTLHRASLAAALLGLSTTAPAGPLEGLTWTTRPLLIFAPAAEHPQARRLRAQLQRTHDDFAARDMALVEVYGTGPARLDGRSLTPNSGRELRRNYQVDPDELALILVGKDGGEKLRAGTGVDIGAIYSLIDTMPMRRREMRDAE